MAASPTPEDPVVAAYEAFLAALSTAMETADPEYAELARRATDQALVNAKARVASLAEQGRVATGAFVSAPQSVTVDEETAEIVDCYGLDFVEFDEGTRQQVADRDGARFEVTVRLVEDGTGDWIVSEYVEGDACAPAEIATEVTRRYLAFWDAVWTASDPADPDHPGLADTAAKEQLDSLRETLTQWREQRYVRRGRGTEHPIVTQVLARDTAAIVRDCVEENPDTGLYDAESGERIEGGARPGQRTLLQTRVELIDGAWRVVDVDVIEEDSTCEPDAS